MAQKCETPPGQGRASRDSFPNGWSRDPDSLESMQAQFLAHRFRLPNTRAGIIAAHAYGARGHG